jgi:hypothetical protein
VSADAQHVWASENEYLIPNRGAARNRERSPKVVYDTVKKIADRAGVNCHVHALRAAFAVRMDELNPGRLVAVKELLGHSRIETTMVYLRRQDKTREMELVRGLTWGSRPSAGERPENAQVAKARVVGPLTRGHAGSPAVDPELLEAAASVGVNLSSCPEEQSEPIFRGRTGSSGFPSNPHVPPAGFEPALSPEADDDGDPAIAGASSLPGVLLAKVEALRDRERV